MREYRFRGKQIDNGKWIFGLLIRKMKKYRAIDYCTLGKRIESTFYIQTLETVNNVDMLEKYKVDPETVGQYTEKKDKNGKEIYEGDIFKRLDTGDTFKVIWKNDCYLATHIYDAWLEKDITQREDNVSLHFMTTYKIEIIGTIHEDPSNAPKA